MCAAARSKHQLIASTAEMLHEELRQQGYTDKAPMVTVVHNTLASLAEERSNDTDGDSERHSRLLTVIQSYSSLAADDDHSGVESAQRSGTGSLASISDRMDGLHSGGGVSFLRDMFPRQQQQQSGLAEDLASDEKSSGGNSGEWSSAIFI